MANTHHNNNTALLHPQVHFTLPPPETQYAAIAEAQSGSFVSTQPSETLSDTTYGQYLSYGQFLWRNNVFSRALSIFYALLRFNREQIDVLSQSPTLDAPGVRKCALRSDRIHAFLGSELTSRGDFERALWHLREITTSSPDSKARAIQQLEILMGTSSLTVAEWSQLNPDPANLAVASLYEGNLAVALDGLRVIATNAGEHCTLTTDLREKTMKLYDLQRS
eukprot:ANDGO_00228.mRNA.1 hypothetical protein